MARNLLPDFDKLATSNVWRASTGPSTRLSSTINPGQPLLSSTGIAEQDLDKVGQGASLLSSNGVCNQAAQSHFQNLEEQRVGVEEAYWSSTGIRDPAILEFHKKLVGNVDQEPEDYASLPDYIKVLDKFAVLFQTSTSQTAAFAKKTAEIKFHDNISQEKMVSTLHKMDKLTVLLQNFHKRPPMKKMEIYKPSKKVSEKSNYLNVNVKEQSKVVNTIYRINSIVESIDDLSKESEAKPPGFQQIGPLIQLWEGHQTTLEVLQDKQKDVDEKLELILADHDDLLHPDSSPDTSHTSQSS